MEGSESEAVFNALNLNPQLFINETLNTVDDLLDDAFNFYLQQASTLLKIDDGNEDLNKGVIHLRNVIQTALDKRLGMWEKYCLRHCFAVPQGFSLERNGELSSESLLSKDALSDPDLDVQLDSIRNELAVAGKESVQLRRELLVLEKRSSASDCFAGLVSEALQLYEQNSVHDMFQEMVKAASELRTKVQNLKAKRTECVERRKTETLEYLDRDLCTNNGNGLYNANLEDLEEFIAELKRI